MLRQKINSLGESFQSFWQILRFSARISYRASPWYFIARFLLVGITTAVPFLSIRVASTIINLLSAGVMGNIDAQAGMKRFLTLILALLAITAVSKAAEKLSTYYQGLHQELIIRYSKYEVMEKSASLDLQFFDSTDFYNEITDADQNASMLSLTSFRMLDFIMGVAQAGVAFGCLSVFSPLLSILLVIAAIPSVVYQNKQLDSIYRFQRENMSSDRKIFYTTELITQREFAKDIKFYNLFPYIGQKYQAIVHELFSGKQKISAKYTRILVLLACMPEVITCIALYLIGSGIFAGAYQVGDFTYYQGIIGQLTASLFIIIYSMSQLNDCKLRIENYLKFMNWENTVHDDGEKKADRNAPFTIEFRHVSFRYNPDAPYILNDLSFQMNSRQKVALAGVNGSGKSTIIKLILRFYDPTQGEILFNGVNIKHFTLDSWRRLFSVMFQDYNNYAFSVRESVALSHIEEVERTERIQKAIAQSGASEFVDAYEHGIETYLTRQYEDDGVELSGGQWQKIALARTFFRDAAYYILDEPSAALDAESEDELFRKFEALYQDKGALLVSHRLSNISAFDQILVLEDGRLVEQGSHAELMRAGGKYARMYRLQAEKYDHSYETAGQ